jgi:hypothetical protein
MMYKMAGPTSISSRNSHKVDLYRLMGRVRGGTMTHVMLRQLFSISIYRSTSMSSSIAFDREKQKNKYSLRFKI